MLTSANTGSAGENTVGSARWHALWALIVAALVAVPGGAVAQPGAEKGESGSQEAAVEESEAASEYVPLSTKIKRAPPEFAGIEVIDHTIGFRDDIFSSVTIDDSGVIWVTTYEGRVYKSTDKGDNWNEYVVLPQVRPLYGFANQKVLLGHLRNPDVVRARETLLGPSGAISANSNSRLMLQGYTELAAQRNSQNLALDPTPSFSESGEFYNALRSNSRRATGEGDIVLGAGLSNRAPRLSLLLSVLRRPTANISMQRLLYQTAARNTFVREITTHPTDPKVAFAATGFGLYKTIDNGVSWFRDFAGMTPKERWIGHVIADPKDPNRMYMGTSRGLFQSDNRGESWYKNTKVPEISIRRVAIDPHDSRYVYVAGHGGMYRSNDRGENFIFAFYHSIRLRRDVYWMVIDPFNPNIAYLGTADGLMRTSNLRDAKIADWEVVDGLRTVNLYISTVDMCTKHPGHMYVQTSVRLPTINYAANGPEALILESWDHGLSWNEIAGNRTMGTVNWFTVDPEDTDTLWVAFSRALVKIQRTGDTRKPDVAKLSAKRLSMGKSVLPEMPTMGQVVRAALEFTELEMDGFVENLDSLRNRNWLPNRLNVTAGYGVWNVGSALEDIQFPGFRYLNVQDHNVWNVTAWLSWTLPDFVYRQDSAPLMRFQELKMVNSVRERIIRTVHRNYGELQRIRIRQRYRQGESLTTRVNLALRAEYLEATVDLACGGYLTRWKKEKNQ